MSDKAGSSAIRMALLPNAFRDTAMTIASLADGATSITSALFREKCLVQLAALRRDLSLAGHQADVVNDAAYAQCALLDETALLRLQGEERDKWEREPLQIREFQTNDTGDQLIATIRRRVAEPRPKLVLLSLFQAVLGLGFKGMFAFDGADDRLEFMRALDKRTGQAVNRDTTCAVLLTQHNARRWNATVGPLGWAVVGVLVAGLVYLGMST